MSSDAWPGDSEPAPVHLDGPNPSVSISALRKHARSQHSGTRTCQRNHGALDAHRARAAIENHVNRIAQTGANVLRCCRRKLRKSICSRSEAASGIAEVRSNSRAMGCAGIRSPTLGSPAVTISGTSARFGTTIVKGPGQKCCARVFYRDIRSISSAQVPGSHLDPIHMHDQRTAQRPTLSLEDSRHRFRVERVCTESVHGLCREGHQPTRAKRRRRLLNQGDHRRRYRSRSCRCGATPATRESTRRDRHPARVTGRQSRGATANPSPADKAPARNSAPGCQS